MGNIGTCRIVTVKDKRVSAASKTALKIETKDSLSEAMDAAYYYDWVIPPYMYDDTYSSSRMISNLQNQLSSGKIKARLLIPIIGNSRAAKVEWIKRYVDCDLYFRNTTRPLGTAGFCRELFWEGFEFKNDYVVEADGDFPFNYYKVSE